MLGVLVKWTAKFGIVGGAVYVTVKEGIWDSSHNGYRALTKVRTTVLPTANEYFMKIPSVNDSSQKVAIYWNCGVETTFKAIEESPKTIKHYTNKGVDYVKKNFISSK
ncbi:MICOS complex subunit MIC13-like [Tubulanus polymorphus]|uniref:MICOS complex subunit MIC13-like n=1 Tax=Tubulanus polymorphus TaxID=672921 RepID=UPI003DA53F7E